MMLSLIGDGYNSPDISLTNEFEWHDKQSVLFIISVSFELKF
ncbi:hypothetical protein DDB_G0281405 [Dictyostelium discoideum AX4]|nr:hypothetical protein DDB_G0281405 [Dictyostelium discoideum AX4]EAL66684.1 hypothetical protein DDB_G0281405 [Dictyostelium discoideum AX4]|eukprot:XP_640655.1 hypothetical protein DDB_G0281405 [Dictyostelium discoideum AX4]